MTKDQLLDALKATGMPYAKLERQIGITYNHLTRYINRKNELPDKYVPRIKAFLKKQAADAGKAQNPPEWDPKLVDRLQKGAADADQTGNRTHLDHDHPFGEGAAIFPIPIPAKDVEKHIQINEAASNFILTGNKSLLEPVKLSKKFDTFQSLVNPKHKAPVDVPFSETTPESYDGEPISNFVNDEPGQIVKPEIAHAVSEPAKKNREYPKHLKTVEPAPGTNAFYLKYGKWE